MILRNKGTGQVEDWAPDYAEWLLSSGIGERITPEAPKVETVVQPPATFTQLEPSAIVNVHETAVSITNGQAAEEDALAAALIEAANKMPKVEAAAIVPAQTVAASVSTPRFSRGPRATQNATR